MSYFRRVYEPTDEEKRYTKQVEYTMSTHGDRFFRIFRTLCQYPTCYQNTSVGQAKCEEAINYVYNVLQQLDMNVEIRGNIHIEGEEYLPPFLIAESSEDVPRRDTLLIYTTLDAIKMEEETNINSLSPEFEFKFAQEGEHYKCMGVATKAPAAAVLCALIAFRKAFPGNKINLRLIFDSSFLKDSRNLMEVLKDTPILVEKNDYTIITCGGPSLDDPLPAINMGYPGIIRGKIRITASEKRLIYQDTVGVVYDPMAQLIDLIKELTTLQTDEEFKGFLSLKLFKGDKLELEDPYLKHYTDSKTQDFGRFNKIYGVERVINEYTSDDFVDLKLKYFHDKWYAPIFTVHSIKSSNDAKTRNDYMPDIASYAEMEFSVKFSVSEDVKHVDDAFRKYLDTLIKKQKTCNVVELTIDKCLNPYTDNLRTAHYERCAHVFRMAFKTEPYVCRSNLPVPYFTMTKKPEYLNSHFVGVSSGPMDAGYGTVDETLPVESFNNMIKLYIAFMYQFSYKPPAIVYSVRR